MKLMNQFFLQIALLFLLSASVNAQTHWCGTDHNEAFMERLTRNVKFANTHAMKMDEKRYIPTKFHLVADSNGNGRMTEEAVYLQLCRMNQQYADIGFVFFIDGEFNYIDDTSIYDHASNAQGKMAGFRNQYPHAVNMFITNATFDEGVAGYYTGQFDLLVVRKSNFTDEQNGTLGHEAAHLFSISHPHYGWEDDPYTPEKYGEIVTILTVSSGQSPNVTVEVMNDPNCDTVGDRICDTPPDYGFTQNGGDGAQVCHNPWEGFVKDRNEVPVINITNLIMGYNGNCQEIVFTEGQGEAMIADYTARVNSNPITLGHLSDDYMPDTTQITEAPAKIAPTAFSTTDYFDSVILQWDPVPGATEYFVRVGLGGGNTETYVTSDTELELTQLEPNTQYDWNVIVKNEIGYCAEGTAKVVFFTGAGSTAVNEIDAVSNFSVQPNPVNNDKLFLSLDLTQSLNAQISMHNATGKSLFGAKNYSLQSGKNKVEIELSNVPTGMYHLLVRTNQGVITEKILVH